MQQQLNDFKATQRQTFQQLQQEEDVLERELAVFEHRLESDAWNESLVVAPKASAPAAPACSATRKVFSCSVHSTNFRNAHSWNAFFCDAKGSVHQCEKAT